MSQNDEANIEIEQESIKELLIEYDGRVLDLNRLSDYDRASMSYFTDRKLVRQPRVNITMTLDVTNAHYVFTNRAKQGDTFTGYLTWGLLTSLCIHPYFSWRYIDEVWYAFDDLPLFIPVATGLPGNRLASVLLNHVNAIDWDSFSQKYKCGIEQARHSWTNPFIDILHWSVYHIIGNLPSIRFNSLTIHESGIETARPIFYFGRRYEDGGKLFIPFTVQFHHATLDPILLDVFITDFLKSLSQ